MGNTRDLIKIRDTKGTFHAKMDSIKDINGMDLTETEDIKNIFLILLNIFLVQEYTKNCKKKIFKTQIIMMEWSFI